MYEHEIAILMTSLWLIYCVHQRTHCWRVQFSESLSKSSGFIIKNIHRSMPDSPTKEPEVFLGFGLRGHREHQVGGPQQAEPVLFASRLKTLWDPHVMRWNMPQTLAMGNDRFIACRSVELSYVYASSTNYQNPCR